MPSAASSRSLAVRIVEVGPRDGLQNVKTVIPTATKIELIDRLGRTGLNTIELTSIVSPKAIPQLADCQKLLGNEKIKTILADTNFRLPVLVPNLKGLDIAINTNVKEVAVFISATEGFSKANINASVDEGLKRAIQVAKNAAKAGMAVRGYISCIFADPYDGPTPQSAVLKVVKPLLENGCYEVSLGDTLGVGVAENVRSLLAYLEQNGIPLSKLAGHFHDTYGQAVSNVWQAYQCGLRTFDSSVGGLGGCPFAPGAKGNVATEDVVYMFQQAGIDTGVDLEQITKIGSWISEQLSKPNDSRAGAALVARNPHKNPKNSTNSGEKDTSITIKWSLVRHDEGLKISRAGASIELLLDRPKNGNALTSEMIQNLTTFFENARHDRSISRIVIRGNGKFFCTGMDLGKGSSPVAQSKEASDAQYERLTRLFEAIDNAPQVTIACINGSAFGGGVGLAFVCDIRVAVETATFTLSEVKLGLCPATISKYVIREWGFAFTRECMLSAQPIKMERLKHLGTIARLARDDDELASIRDEYLVQLKGAAPEASSMSKELVKLAYVDAGGEGQAKGIKALFDKMMRSDSEAAIGLREFQAGRRKLDWDSLLEKKAKL